jgi:hypothetical protein
MMPDNWAFVIAAYGLATIVLAAYWRFLSRREKELNDASVVCQHQRQGAGFAEPHARRPS